jgi:hypothetical protein
MSQVTTQPCNTFDSKVGRESFFVRKPHIEDRVFLGVEEIFSRDETGIGSVSPIL